MDRTLGGHSAYFLQESEKCRRTKISCDFRLTRSDGKSRAARARPTGNALMQFPRHRLNGSQTRTRVLWPQVGKAQSWLDCRPPSKTFTFASMAIFSTGSRLAAEATRLVSTPSSELSSRPGSGWNASLRSELGRAARSKLNDKSATQLEIAGKLKTLNRARRPTNT